MEEELLQLQHRLSLCKAMAEPLCQQACKNVSSGATEACGKIKSLRTEQSLKESFTLPMIPVGFCEGCLVSVWVQLPLSGNMMLWWVVKL